MVQVMPPEAWEQEFFRLSYEWEKIYAYGDMDSMCTDGIILNQIRQELLRIKKKLEDLETVTECKIPPEMEAGYMAKAEQIRTQAQTAVQEYLALEEYRYVLVSLPKMTRKQKQETHAREIFGKVQSLVNALAEDNLVVLREYGSPGMLTELIVETAKRLWELPLKEVPDLKEKQEENEEDWQIEGQMSIYDLNVF